MSLREEIRALLGEDAHNAQRILTQLDAMQAVRGIGPHAAALLALTRKTFADEEAERHWEALSAHRQEMSIHCGRDVGLRVAVLDYFLNVNRSLIEPMLIDLHLLEEAALDRGRDPLTGLTSERRFREGLTAEVRRARRYGFPTAVILFDVDNLARASTTFGDVIAQRMLKETAILIRNKVRDIDLVARCGDDEITVLLPETDRNGALLVAERCRRAVERHFETEAGEESGLTISGGIASYPHDGVHADGLLSCAAQGLYVAKANGKNRIQLYESERRRYLRFDLAEGPFELEILPGKIEGPLSLLNLSCDGLLFASPEPIVVGEQIELRLLPSLDVAAEPMRGVVVRLEQVDGEEEEHPSYEIGVVFDAERAPSREALLRFLARGQHALGEEDS